jgi:hypothetical protein
LFLFLKKLALIELILQANDNKKTLMSTGNYALIFVTTNGCFGSLAVVQHSIIRTSAFGGEADIAEIFTGGPEGSIFPSTFEFTTPRYFYALPREEF